QFVTAARPKKRRPSLRIQVNTSNTVEGSAVFDAHVRDVISSTLSRFVAQLTRVEVHLSDENAAKKGVNDKRCLIEARPEFQKALATTAIGSTIDQALRRAAGKMKRLLTTRFATHPKTQKGSGVRRRWLS